MKLKRTVSALLAGIIIMGLLPISYASAADEENASFKIGKSKWDNRDTSVRVFGDYTAEKTAVGMYQSDKEGYCRKVVDGTLIIGPDGQDYKLRPSSENPAVLPMVYESYKIQRNQYNANDTYVVHNVPDFKWYHEHYIYGDHSNMHVISYRNDMYGSYNADSRAAVLLENSSFLLYTAWKDWDSANYNTVLDDFKKDNKTSYGVVLKLNSYDNNVHTPGDWNAVNSSSLPFYLPEGGDLYDLRPELSSVVNEAFGENAYDVYHNPKALLTDLSYDEFRVRSSQLMFLHILCDGTDVSSDDMFPFGLRLYTKEEQEELKKNMVGELVESLDVGSADITEIYWMLQYYGAQAPAQYKGSELDSYLSTDGLCSDWMAAYIKYTQNASIVSQRLGGSSFYGSSEPAKENAQYAGTLTKYVYSHYATGVNTNITNDGTQVRQASFSGKSAANFRPYVLSAYDTLLSQAANTHSRDTTQSGNSPKLYMANDSIVRIEQFVQTLWVTYGVMVGILDENALDVISVGVDDNALLQTKGGMLYTPAPLFMRDISIKINTKGAIYFLLAYNDYRGHVFELVNGVAPYLTGKMTANSTAAVYQYKNAIMMMKQLLDVFDDENMWDVWFDKSMDISNGHSLSDIYDYLVATHAFDASMDTGLDGQIEDDFAYFFTDTALSHSMLVGLKQSATFLPMRTNVYDPSTWQGKVDTDWLLNYYAKFGYFRKALYIDTNADAAVTFGNTGGRGNLAVATLEDLIQDKDVVLYLDDNLYNVNTLSELIGKAWDRLGQGEETDARDRVGKLGAQITNLWEVGMPELAKTGEKTTYSSRVKDANQEGTTWGNLFFKGKDFVEKKVEASPSAGEEEEPIPSASPAPTETTTYAASSNSDSISYYLYPDKVWDTTSNQIVEGTHTTEYTPLFGFAVLSGVYQNDRLKQSLNATLSSSTPVFVSSGTAPYVCDSLRTSIYNYMLCRNLEAQMTVDYTVSMDMTSPIYMDIFGNILTESGYVVIPAAANATLFTSYYTPRNAAFFACYGDAYYLPAYEEEPTDAVHKMLTSGSQKLCTLRNGKYQLNALQTTDMTVNAAMLSTASAEALQDIADTFATIIKTNSAYSISKWKMLVTEVLRGAPIEYIDKQFEGLTTNVAYTRQGLIIADKLETLTKAIAPVGQNASLAIPNPAFMDGIEIIVFFVYKLLILAVLIIWMVNVYLDATGGTIGLKTGFKCIGVVVLVLALIVGVPKVFELSYYESNKLLLQQETEYLLMLNTEKQANGQEIGVSKVSPPETNTTLYLHLADIQMPWWDLLSKIGLSAGYKSLNEMYDDYANKHPLAGTEYATVKNDGIYISVDQLFDSAKVQFSPLSKRIFLAGDNNTPASYYTPYYFFLNCLVEDISNWSKDNHAIAYTTKVQKGGELKTLGYCRLFFEDPEFIEEGGDLFHLYDVYNIQKPRVIPYQSELDPELELAPLRHSQWCNFDSPKISEKGYIDRINRLQKYAQEWIANNHDMIGRVSDETFLKCFALSCAMEHNRLFNTQRADYLEIQELSNEDLLRLSIGDHNTVLSNSSMSYARYVYSTGGTIAVYLAAVLELVNLVGSWVKPACTLLVFCIACISIFVLKLILRRGNNSITGYILTITLMCSVNVLGAVVTKLSMFLPNTGLTPSICILLQIFVQVIYIMLQFKIVSFALRDWQNVGYQHYEHAYNKIHIGYRQPMLSRNVATPRGTTGYPAYDSMMNTLNSRRLIK